MVGSVGFGRDLGTGRFVVTGDSSGAEAALDRTEKRVFGFATTVRGAGIQMQLFGRGILNMVGNVVGVFITFEDAFIGVTRTVNATEEEFRLLEAGIRDMALVIPIAASDLANIMKIAGQMGIRGVENLLAFTETVARMAAVTDLTEESTAFAFARIAKIMGLPIPVVANLGASVVDLGNKFATTEPLIVDSAVRAAGAANTLGISTQDLVGITAALTVVMPRAQSAGTVLARTFTEMAEAGFQGGESLSTFATTVGISTEAMRELIQTDPTEALIRFLEGLGDLIRRGGNWVEVLDAVGLNQIRTREGALNLASAGDLLRNTVLTSNEAWNENIALLVESDRRFASLSSQLGLFRNLLTEINIILGKALSPVIKDVTERLKPFFQGIRDFTEAHPQLIQILGALVAAFGAIAFIAGTALIVAAVVGIFGLVSLTVFLVVTAIIALVAAFAALIIFWPEIKTFFENLPKVMMGFLRAAGSAMLGVLSSFADIVVKFFTQTIPGALTAFRGVLKDFGVGIRNTLKNFGVDILNFVTGTFVAIRNRLKEFGLGILSTLTKFGKDMRTRLNNLGEGIKNTLRDKFDQLITPVIEAFREIVKTVVFWFDNIRTAFTTAFNIYKKIVQTEFNIIRSIIETVFRIIRTIFQKWFNISREIVQTEFNIIRSIFETAFRIIREIVQFAVNLIKDRVIIPWINALRNIFTVGWNLITSVIRFAWDLIVPIVTLAISLIKNLVIAWFETLKNVFQAGWTIISSIINIVWTIIKNLVLIGVQFISGTIRVWMAVLRGDWGAAWDAIKDTFSRVWDLIKDTVTTVIGEVKDIIMGVWNFIKDETSTIWTLIKDSVLDALRAIRDTGKVILNVFIGIFEKALNFIIDGINTYISTVNKFYDGLNKASGIFGIPEIPDIPKVPSISIPRLAHGALALSPMLAVVGDVPEIIIPLDKLDSMGMGSTGPFFAPVSITVVSESPAEMFDKLGEALR